MSEIEDIKKKIKALKKKLSQATGRIAREELRQELVSAQTALQQAQKRRR